MVKFPHIVKVIFFILSFLIYLLYVFIHMGAHVQSSEDCMEADSLLLPFQIAGIKIGTYGSNNKSIVLYCVKDTISL